MFTLKNRVEIVAQLVEILRQFDIECNGYDTLVYLKYNADTQTAELETFIDVGSLDDDYVFIYRDSNLDHINYCVWDWIESKKEISDLLGKPEEEIAAEVKDYFDDNEDDNEDEEDENDVYLSIKKEYAETQEWIEYIQTNDDYVSIIIKAYDDYLKTYYAAEYNEKAEEIIEKFENGEFNEE